MSKGKGMTQGARDTVDTGGDGSEGRSGRRGEATLGSYKVDVYFPPLS